MQKQSVFIIRRNADDGEGAMPPGAIRDLLEARGLEIAVMHYMGGKTNLLIYILRLRRDAARLQDYLQIKRTSEAVEAALGLVLGPRSRRYRLVLPSGRGDQPLDDEVLETAGITALTIARR